MGQKKENEIPTVQVGALKITKSRFRDKGPGKEEVLVAGWIPLAHYSVLAGHADKDLGDRWESLMLRKVVREWVERK